MEFRILGPLEVRGEFGAVALGGGKPRAVLAFLLLHPNEPVSAERLALELWGADAPAGAVKRVHVHVSRLRKALGDPEIVDTTPAGYRLRVRPGELDAERFEQLLGEGRHALDDGRAERAATVLRDALAMWRGPPLADLAFEPFVQNEIASLEDRRLIALETRLDADLATGGHAAVLGELQRLVAANLTREKLAGQLMLALYRCGRQTDALAVYRDAHRVLVEEVGVEPGPELRRLQAAILRHDGSLEPHALTDELSPALEAAAASPLVGRGAELAWLQARWERARAGTGTLVTVIGEHGIGKTRLVAELATLSHRAGAVVLYASGADPPEPTLAALRHVRRATTHALVVVDDADRMGAFARATLGELDGALAGVPALVIATGEDGGALEGLGSGAIALRPLDTPAARAIARLYAPGHAEEELPEDEFLEAARGIPGRIHELASEWARDEAARRVRAVAGRAATGRAELRSIETELASGIVELQAARERPLDPNETPVVCPFKGLAAFEAADAEYFFGRERLVAELVARLVGAPLLGIVGPSGTGKSSVVRAGLMPALAAGVLPGSEQWDQVVMRPTDHPLAELTTTTAGDDEHRLVLAVDQFEETFTACEDEAERAAFIAALIRIARDRQRPGIVVLAIRADHYGGCAAYDELSSLLAANHVLVGPMRRDELRRAVERPALLAGLRVEPELVDALVNDVEGEPGALPLLSTALLELWQHRDGRRLRHVAYEQTGGVRGAVARLAESAFGELEPSEHAIARHVLLRLTAEGTEGAVERRRVPLSGLQVQHRDDVARVVAVLTDRRLLTVSAGTAEVAHEALLREWPRLRGWLEEDAEGRRLHRHLTDAARDWDRRGRDPGDVYRGARLASAQEWRAEHELELSQTERAFLDAAHANEQSELEAAQRRTRRLRTMVLGLAALVVVAAISTALAVRQTDRATSESRRAISRSLAAQALSTLERDPDVAALLGLEAYRVQPTLEARSALLTALSDQQHRAGTFKGHTAPVGAAAFSRDGKVLASAAFDGSVRMWDVAARRALGAPLTGHTGRVHAVTFSPDGTTLASAGEDGAVSLWDVGARRAPGAPLTGDSGPVLAMAFSGDGTMLASAGADGTVRMWDVATGRARGKSLTRRPVASVALNDDGTTLAVAGYDGTLRLWDVGGRRSLGRSLTRRPDPVLGVAFSPDGATLASTGADGTVRLWDVATRRSLGQPATGHTGPVYGVAFSPDGTTLASTGGDGTVRVWDAASLRSLGRPLTGPTSGVRGAAFSADGATLASVHGDGTVRLWNIAAQPTLARPLGGRAGFVAAVAFSANAATLAIAGEDQAVQLWDVLEQRALGRPLTGHSVTSVALSGDGTTLVSARADGTLPLLDVAGRRALRQPLTGHGSHVRGLAFSADGATLASAGEDRTVRLWDVASRRPLGRPLTGHTEAAAGLAFTPDGKTLASAGADATVRLWDVASRRPLGRPLTGHTGPVLAVAFSTDGKTLASAGAEGTVLLWEVTATPPLGRPLTGHIGPVIAVAFSPDGRTLASAGADATVRLWDVAARRALGRPLTGHTISVLAAAFSRDGRTLASAGGDGTVRLWDSILWSDNRQALQRRVCETVQRSLSRAEWAELLPGEPYHETCGP